MADEIGSASTTEMRAAADELKRTMKELESLSGSFATGLTSGLKSAVSEGKKLDTIFRDIGRSMSLRLLDMALQPLRESLTKGFSTLFSGAGSSGGGLTLPFLGNLWPFARGGVISSPVAFPLSGGDLGLAGEAGAEAIMPLARGADGRLGVRGGGNGGMSVTFNVTTPDAESFRKSEAQVTTMLARAVGRGRRGL